MLGYKWYRSITVDNTKVSGSEDLIDFAVLVKISDTYLKSVANGGDIENSNGYDIIFTSDIEGCTQPLNHEISRYNDTTGELLVWVKIPTLQYDEDTTFYMFYGNPSITTSQENISETWNANYETVVHMNDDSSSSIVFDSAAGDHNAVFSDSNGEVNTNTVSDLDGKIYKSLLFNGVDHRINHPNIDPDHITMSGWARTTSSAKQEITNDAQDTWHIRIVGQASIGPTCIVKVGGVYYTANFPDTKYDGEWHYVVGTWDGEAARVYVDGVEGTPDTSGSGNLDTVTGPVYIGIHANLVSNPMDGDLDELRISNIALTSGWIVTDFNNQDSPFTFISVGEAVCGSNKFIQTLCGDPMGISLANVKSVIGVSL